MFCYLTVNRLWHHTVSDVIEVFAMLLFILPLIRLFLNLNKNECVFPSALCLTEALNHVFRFLLNLFRHSGVNTAVLVPNTLSFGT